MTLKLLSKPKLVVLGFLMREPMYGYQIGHIVEQFGLPVWAGIKLPSIYKALQDLEAAGQIRGEQVTEGNNPPRTVFHIKGQGRKLHRQLVLLGLTTPQVSSQDWWLTLSFAGGSITRKELESAIHRRLERLQEQLRASQSEFCQNLQASGRLPFVHKHILRLGERHHQVEAKNLKELLADVLAGGAADFYLGQGDET